MEIPDGMRENFRTLLRAAANGSLAAMDCYDTVEKRSVVLIVAVQPDDSRPGGVQLIPLGRVLGDDNPYERYQPPSPDIDGEYAPIEKWNESVEAADKKAPEA